MFSSHSLIEEWNVKSSNTGRLNGACIRVERDYLAHKVFWLACRHHVSELLIGAAWYALFTEDPGPDNKDFKHVKDSWPDMEISSDSTYKKLTLRSPFLRELKSSAIEFYTQILSSPDKNGLLPRDDYKELAETSLILLGGSPPGGISWKKPGAVHKARFMANSLYSNVMYAFQDSLQYDETLLTPLRRFVVFNTLIYAPHFLSASFGADAPMNDLKLFKLLCAYKSVDRELADKVLEKFQLHLWYLTEEAVVLSLFSFKLEADEKSRIAARLLTFPVPSSLEPGKPVFPKIELSTQLVDLVGPKSWLLFNLLGVGHSWLEKDVSLWEEDDSFRLTEAFARSVKTVNDTAERGVKMMTDYAQILSKDDSVRELILQGVERHRFKFPNFDKKTLNS